MAGRVLFPALDDPETILPTMSAELFPALFTGIFLVIVLAAIMSTADSLLLLASSAVVRDLVQKIFHPDLSEKSLSFYGKLTTVIIGACALVFALAEVRVIFGSCSLPGPAWHRPLLQWSSVLFIGSVPLEPEQWPEWWVAF